MTKVKNLPRSEGNYVAEFKCPLCENIVVRQRSNGNRQKSCGCQRRARAPGKLHGLSKTRFYRIWQDMNLRCSQPKNDSYKWYGAKGIEVCVDWNRDNSYGFENFMKDMYDTYFDAGTIDRKDSKGNYEKDNCRWLTRSENTRRSAEGRVMPKDQKEVIAKANTKYTKENILEVYNFLVEGGTTIEAEAKFKIPRLSINRGLKKCNLVKPKSNYVYTPPRELLSKVEKITELISNGLSITKACAQVGLARQTYRKHKDKI